MVRGKQPELDNERLMKLGSEIFNWASSKDTAEISTQLNQPQREDFASYGIKIHNKVRNLTGSTYSNFRGILKASAAWILVNFSKSNPVGVSTIVKLLSRSSQDLKEGPFVAEALLCCEGAVDLWNRSSVATLEKSLPPVEFQDLRIAVFQGFIDISQLSENKLQIKKAIDGALEIVNTLPNGLKFSFAETVIDIATINAVDPHYSEAIHYFKLALHTIDVIKMSLTQLRPASIEVTDSGHVDPNQLERIKIIAHLSLAFSYNQMK